MLLTVKVAGVAAPFSTVAVTVPSLALSADKLTLLPLSCKSAEPYQLEVKTTALGLAAFKAPALPSCTVPLPIVTPPVKVFVPLSCVTPA